MKLVVSVFFYEVINQHFNEHGWVNGSTYFHNPKVSARFRLELFWSLPEYDRFESLPLRTEKEG